MSKNKIVANVNGFKTEIEIENNDTEIVLYYFDEQHKENQIIITKSDIEEFFKAEKSGKG